MKQLQKQHLVDTLKEILKAVAKINEVFATSILKTVRSRKKKKDQLHTITTRCC